MKPSELIEKLQGLYLDAERTKDEVHYALDEIRGLENQIEHAQDTAEEFKDNIESVVIDIKQNPIGTNAYIDQDELGALLEWKDLVDDFIHKIVNHRGASINRKAREDEDNQ